MKDPAARRELEREAIQAAVRQTLATLHAEVSAFKANVERLCTTHPEPCSHHRCPHRPKHR